MKINSGGKESYMTIKIKIYFEIKVLNNKTEFKLSY